LRTVLFASLAVEHRPNTFNNYFQSLKKFFSAYFQYFLRKISLRKWNHKICACL